MTLWIIAAVAGAILLASIAFLALPRDEPDEPRNTLPPPQGRPPSHRPPPGRASMSPRPSMERAPMGRTSDEPPGSLLASVPPASGVPRAPTPSEELPLSVEGDLLWLEDDDEPTGPVPRILVSASGGTHPGKKRRHNEDAFLVLPEHELYAIADGMGGYAAGEVAAAMTVQTLQKAFEAGEHGKLEEGFPRRGAELMNTIRAANRRIRRESARDERKKGMGTTVVAVRFSPGRRRAYIAHVGDSRCYRIRDGRLEQMTEDHTLGAVGIKGPSAAKLSRAVGVFEHVDVELTVDEPLPGDHYLLCSDGLYKMVPDEMIAHLVGSAGSTEAAVKALIDEANARGGRDNVSVVLVRIDEPNVRVSESGAHRLQ